MNELWIIAQRLAGRALEPIVLDATRDEAMAAFNKTASTLAKTTATTGQQYEVELINQTTAQTVARQSSPKSKPRTTTSGRGVFPKEPAQAGFNLWLLAAGAGAVWYFGFRKRG